MIYYVNASASRSGDGSQLRPFQRISEAAAIAVAGDEVLVAPGVYHEHVAPVNGGTDDRCRITYRSIEPLKAVITGAERVVGWTKVEGSVWTARIPNSLFGSYNPYTTVVQGDWYWPVCLAHTGEVYLNDKSLYEVDCLERVLKPEVFEDSWDPDFSIYAWYTEQDGDETVLYANFHQYDPNAENVEINVRRNCFYPDRTGVNYITLSGFTVCKAATQWAPPTAYQEGMIGPRWSKGWIIEDCEVSHSKCSGISLGKYLQPNNENKWTTRFYKEGSQNERDSICQAVLEGWTKENIGSHIVRRCHIHDCGQTGIVGHLGGAFSLIEDNHIHHINFKQNLTGAEIGGIKMHAAIDVVFRRNHIHHCTRGLWLDWQAQGTRVTQNLFHHNLMPAGKKLGKYLAVGEDIFVEVSHGPTLIDNNVLLSDFACRLSTQGLAFVHNLIAGSFTCVGNGTNNGTRDCPSPRYTPYHVPHRTEVLGFMSFLHGDARFYNNIFVQQPERTDLAVQLQERGVHDLGFYHFICGTKPYDGYPTPEDYFGQFTTFYAVKDVYFGHLPVYTGGNVYFGGAQPCDTEKDATIVEGEVTLALREENGEYRLETNLYDLLPEMKLGVIATEMLGEAFEPEQKFEAADGSPITFDEDYFGSHRGLNPLPGPFVCPKCARRTLN